MSEFPQSPGAVSIAGTVYPLPNMDAVNDVLQSMKETLETLGVTFDALGQASAKVADLHNAPGLDNNQQIVSLKKQLYLQDRRQEQKIEDIKRLLRDVLQEQIIEHLKRQIALQISDAIEEEVEYQVATQLAYLIPEHLQATVEEHQRQLDDVQRSLNNSEARRANASLRAQHMENPLSPMMTSEGVVSSHFPPTIHDLFALDADAAAMLVQDYGLVPLPTREQNLNKFMQFCGIGYQMVPSATAAIAL